MNRYRSFIFLAATLSAALWAYACGDGTTEPPPPENPDRAPVVVGVIPPHTINPDETATLDLTPYFSDLEATHSPTWHRRRTLRSWGFPFQAAG